MEFLSKRNTDTFSNLISNLHTLVMSMRKDKSSYDFFNILFKHDLSQYSEDSRKKIIDTIIEEYKKCNTGFGDINF